MRENRRALAPEQLPRPLDLVASALEDSGWAAEVFDLHFERMARLVEPGRREAAILFADIEASTKLSRRLPTSTYFAFIRDFSTAGDDVIIDGGGIVGDHAGDGLTAFFVVDDFGAASPAARAAIEVGRGRRSRSGAGCRQGSTARAATSAWIQARSVCASGCTGSGCCTWARWSPAAGSR